MIILEEPYVSQTLLNYLTEHQIPILKNQYAEKVFPANPKLNLIERDTFAALYHKNDNPALYSVSEYALEDVFNTIKNPELNRQINLLKDKAAFRRACRNMYPDFVFEEVSYEALFAFDTQKLKFPVVLKPSVGFLSAGVYTILSKTDWDNALKDIEQNFTELAALFPEVVVQKAAFIIESYIKGTEYAVDVFFKNKEAAIVNIFEHPFVSKTDVSDRFYKTNKAIFDQYLDIFRDHFNELNKYLDLDNIPVHIELRVDEGKIIPIEINPLRFTGLCLNDIHYFITGKHPVSYYLEQTTPNYAEMWHGREDVNYCFSIFEIPKHPETSAALREEIKSLYSKILEFRAVDQSNLKINAFVFSQSNSKGTIDEAQKVLNFDVNHF